VTADVGQAALDQGDENLVVARRRQRYGRSRSSVEASGRTDGRWGEFPERWEGLPEESQLDFDELLDRHGD
jgi:hypothetical protein